MRFKKFWLINIIWLVNTIPIIFRLLLILIEVTFIFRILWLTTCDLLDNLDNFPYGVLKFFVFH